MNNEPTFSLGALGFIVGGIIAGILIGSSIQAQWGDDVADFLNGVFLAVGVLVGIIVVLVGSIVLKEEDQ